MDYEVVTCKYKVKRKIIHFLPTNRKAKKERGAFTLAQIISLYRINDRCNSGTVAAWPPVIQFQNRFNCFMAQSSLSFISIMACSIRACSAEGSLHHPGMRSHFWRICSGVALLMAFPFCPRDLRGGIRFT